MKIQNLSVDVRGCISQWISSNDTHVLNLPVEVQELHRSVPETYLEIGELLITVFYPFSNFHSKRRYDYAAIRITRNVERIRQKLWVFIKPRMEKDVQLMNNNGVTWYGFVARVGIREACPCRRIHEDDTANLGPRCLSVEQSRQATPCVAIEVEVERTDLVDEAGEGGAAGPAGEPEQDRVLLRIALRLDEVVEEADAVVQLHVPCFQGEGQGSAEPRQTRHGLRGDRRRRGREEGVEEEEEEKLG